jgi:hypothetical protein
MRNSTWLWKLLKITEFRTPTQQDVRNKGSKILKLPPVLNCLTSAMTNKLVVLINSLKVPKIKKILLCEMKFLVPNYSCLQNPWLGGSCPQIPVLSVLCPQLNWLNPPPAQTSWVRHFSLLLYQQEILRLTIILCPLWYRLKPENYYILLIVHPNIMIVFFYQLDAHNFFILIYLLCIKIKKLCIKLVKKTIIRKTLFDISCQAQNRQ